MRILLINQYAGSPSLGMEYRPHWMALEWQKLGHKVLVVTGDRSHLRASLPPGRAEVEGVDYQVLTTTPYQRNGAKRFANILSFGAQLLRHRDSLASWEPDVVIASSTHPLDTRGAIAVAERSAALFVYEVHDLWPLTPMLLGGMSPSHPVIRLMKNEERRAYRKADLVVSLLPKTEDYMRANGLRPNRWVWIPNGYDPAVAETPSQASNAADDAKDRIRAFRERWSTVLIYAGTHGKANALDALLDVAHYAAELSLGLVLVGDGPDKERLAARANGMENVLLVDRVPRADLGELLALADGGYVGLLPSPLYDHGISLNKIFDYMGAGLPILENAGAANSPTRDANCGVVSDPKVPGDLQRALRDFCASSQDQRDTWAANGRRYVADFLSQRRLARSMLDSIAVHRQEMVAHPDSLRVHTPVEGAARTRNRPDQRAADQAEVADLADLADLADAMEWDVRNWSKAADFWLDHLNKPIRGSRVLEVGGRDGGLSVWFARLGAEAVVCTDLDGPSDLAHDRIRRAGFADVISTANADATDLDYNREFDYVVFKSVLGGVGGALGSEGQRAALVSMHQALKPGGQLLFAENLTASGVHQYMRRRFVAWGDRWMYVSADDLYGLLADFTDVQLESFGLVGAFGRSERQRDLLARIDSRLMDRVAPADWHYIMAGVATRT